MARTLTRRQAVSGALGVMAAAAAALARRLPDAPVAVAKGCHDGWFWQRQAPAQLCFLSEAWG
jgi:hypothetical protein